MASPSIGLSSARAVDDGDFLHRTRNFQQEWLLGPSGKLLRHFAAPDSFDLQRPISNTHRLAPSHNKVATLAKSTPEANQAS
jgi:hypothetical protein